MTILTQKLTPKEKEGYKLAHLCPLSQDVGDLKKKKTLTIIHLGVLQCSIHVH